MINQEIQDICKDYATKQGLSDNQFAFKVGIEKIGGIAWARGWINGTDIPKIADLVAIKSTYHDWRHDLATELMDVLIAFEETKEKIVKGKL